ncbi:MAG: hypothetical protein ACYTCV_10175 [Planctomycetota bacterium]|jgi:hypothetical protein
MSLRDWVDPRRVEPVAAAVTAKKQGGSNKEAAMAVLDPNQHYLDRPKQNEAVNAALMAKKKRKKRKQVYAAAGRKPPGMKKGGQVKTKPHKHGDNCRGMGCATRGGKFGRNG